MLHYHILFFGLIVWAILSEYMQRFTPHRTFDLIDILANVMGIFTFGCIHGILVSFPWCHRLMR